MPETQFHGHSGLCVIVHIKWYGWTVALFLKYFDDVKYHLLKIKSAEYKTVYSVWYLFYNMFAAWISLGFISLAYECKWGLMSGCVKNVTVYCLYLHNSVSSAVPRRRWCYLVCTYKEFHQFSLLQISLLVSRAYRVQGTQFRFMLGLYIYKCRFIQKNV